MKAPTAAELYELLRNPNPPPTSYEGGMDLESGQCVAVKSRGGVITVAPNIDFEGMRGFVHLILDLSPQESAELRLALERAERAAENWKKENE